MQPDPCAERIAEARAESAAQLLALRTVVRLASWWQAECPSKVHQHLVIMAREALSDSTQAAEEAKRHIVQPWREALDDVLLYGHDHDLCNESPCPFERAGALLHDTSVTQEPKE